MRRVRRRSSPARGPRTRLDLLATGALLLVGSGLWWQGRRPNVRREPGQSVLLVTVDTLRADAVGAYGKGPVAETPWMDQLAARGVLFTTAHAHNVITLPSHANILSGRYPFDHGIRDNSGFRFPKSMETLATLLKAQGYRTGAFVSAFPLDSRFGLDRGFDVYDDRFGGEDARTAFHVQERRGVDTISAAVRWRTDQGDIPSFCWVHVYDPHFPYEPPEPFASRFRENSYGGEVAAVDVALGALLKPILEAGPGSRTLVVLTADHGESLGEHGEMTHGIFTYEPTLRVPLILHQPRILRPAVVEEPVRHVDILPTILDALTLPIPEDFPGRSLLPAANGKKLHSDSTYFESVSPSLNRGWAPIHGVIREGIKYIDLPLPELYDLPKDPGELANLVAERPVEREGARERLALYRASDHAPVRSAESAETRERLRSLGYVTASAGSRPGRYTEDDDPKRLIALDQAVQQVLTRYKAGDLPGALALSRELVQKRPMSVSLMHLAFLLREAGDMPGAVAAAKKALAVNPDDTEVVSLLGVYLNEAGRSREAADLLEPYVSRAVADPDVLIARGVALAALGRPEAALATFAQVRAIDSSNPMALVNEGTVHLMRGDLTRAQQTFKDALELDPGVARAYNGLGVIAAEQGRPDEAVKEWTRSVSLDPHAYQTLYNLGSTLSQLGRPKEARLFFERYLQEAPRFAEARDRERVLSWLRRTAGSAGS